jgi:hypothetical protein
VYNIGAEAMMTTVVQDVEQCGGAGARGIQGERAAESLDNEPSVVSSRLVHKRWRWEGES